MIVAKQDRPQWGPSEEASGALILSLSETECDERQEGSNGWRGLQPVFPGSLGESVG